MTSVWEFGLTNKITGFHFHHQLVNSSQVHFSHFLHRLWFKEYAVKKSNSRLVRPLLTTQRGRSCHKPDLRWPRPLPSPSRTRAEFIDVTCQRSFGETAHGINFNCILMLNILETVNVTTSRALSHSSRSSYIYTNIYHQSQLLITLTNDPWTLFNESKSFTSLFLF